MDALTWLLREANTISQNSDSLWKLVCAGSGNVILIADISTNCSFLVTDYVSLITLYICYVTIKVMVLITQTELVHILLKLQSVV